MADGRQGENGVKERLEIAIDVAMEEGLAALLAEETLAGRVHSVFRNVINWREDRSGRLYCLTSSQVDCAHETVVTSLPSLEGQEVPPGTPVVLGARMLSLGEEARLAFRSLRTLPLCLAPWPADTRPLQRALRDCLLQLRRKGMPGGMLAPAEPQSGDAQLMISKLTQGRGAMEAAVRSGDEGAFLAAARGLLGLGYGLTPSGDDYLSGLLLTFHIPGGPLWSWAEAGGKVAAFAAASTTDIGAWEIRHAAEGWPRENIAAFLKSMFTGEGTYSQKLDKILSIGSLSGTDLATGILSGVALALEAAGGCCATLDR